MNVVITDCEERSGCQGDSQERSTEHSFLHMAPRQAEVHNPGIMLEET